MSLPILQQNPDYLTAVCISILENSLFKKTSVGCKCKFNSLSYYAISATVVCEYSSSHADSFDI